METGMLVRFAPTEESQRMQVRNDVKYGETLINDELSKQIASTKS